MIVQHVIPDNFRCRTRVKSWENGTNCGLLFRTQRWSSALHVYQQMSTIPMSRASIDEEELVAAANAGCDAVVGEFDENLQQQNSSQKLQVPQQQHQHHQHQQQQQQQQQQRPSAPVPGLTSPAAPIPQRPGTLNQAGGRAGQAASSVLSPSSASSSLFSPRLGFMTPPVRTIGFSVANMASPPRRKSSSVSPGESSLNSLELEAIAAVHELQFAVKDIYVSEMLPRTSELIFLNVTTLEGQAYCVELTMKGWRVTSLRHDCMNGDVHHLDLHVRYFETIYALMDQISPGYRQQFTETLSAKLAAVVQERRAEEQTLSEKENRTQTARLVV